MTWSGPRPRNPSGCGRCRRAIVDEMWASGLMSAFNPTAAGGVEPSFQEMIDTWIEMAWQDGSFGWIGIANLPSTFAAATYLPDEGFAEVFTRNDNHITIGGQYFPNGQGDGGRRWLPADRGVEFRLRHRTLGVHRSRLLPDGRRRDALGQRRHSGHASGVHAPRTRSPSPTDGMSRDSRELAPTTTTSPTSSCRSTGPSRCSSASPSGVVRRRAGWA